MTTTRTKKQHIRLANRSPQEPELMPAHVTESGRWAAIKRAEKRDGSEWTVIHVPTGLSAAAGTRTLAEAKVFLAAFDNVATPELDLMPFGQLSRAMSDRVKPELLTVWAARTAVRREVPL